MPSSTNTQPHNARDQVQSYARKAINFSIKDCSLHIGRQPAGSIYLHLQKHTLHMDIPCVCRATEVRSRGGWCVMCFGLGEEWISEICNCIRVWKQSESSTFGWHRLPLQYGIRLWLRSKLLCAIHMNYPTTFISKLFGWSAVRSNCCQPRTIDPHTYKPHIPQTASRLISDDRNGGRVAGGGVKDIPKLLMWP